jgi:hypothetical protein
MPCTLLRSSAGGPGLWVAILCLLGAFPASAQQDFRRWEAGLQLVRLDLDSIGEGPLGAGGRMSYYLTRSFAVEAEVNRYFEDPSHNFGHTQVLAGARYGLWFGPLGVFAKAQPGLMHLGGATALRNPGRENHFSLNVGGAILIGRDRFSLRIDAGDSITFWGAQPFNVGVPREITKHNRQLGIGFLIRF